SPSVLHLSPRRLPRAPLFPYTTLFRSLPVATTFNGKGVFPDDHRNALGAVGFMRHDYVNFGFDEADVLIAVGYEPQEFDPAKVNPDADQKIIHIHQFPAEVDEHYPVEISFQGDLSRSPHALADR